MSKDMVLQVESVSYNAGGNTILKDISFTLHPNEIVGLIGPNGAGKTTLVKIIIGDIRKYEGSAWVQGEIGYLPQYRSIDRYFPITVYEVARMGLYRFEKKLSFIRGNNRRALIMQSLERCGIEHLASRKIGTLSGGEYQRLLLARAILMQPDLMILDEPEAGVDEMGKKSFFSLLTELQEERDMAILMISHDIGLIYKACERVMCLNKTLHCSKPSDEMSIEDLQSVFYDRDILIHAHDHYQEKHRNQ